MNSQLHTLLSDESFQRWLDGEALAAEKRKWSKWLRSERVNRIIYTNAVFLWKTIRFRSHSLPFIKYEWERLKQRLHFDVHTNAVRSIQISPLQRMISKYQSSLKILRYSFAAAAVIIFIMAIRYFSINPTPNKNNSTWNLVTTNFGQRKHIHLPQDIDITLNANSSLKYPGNISSSESIRLQLHGEAYFDVKHHRHQSLDVATCDGCIKVVGTKFVVHERNAGTEVVVEQGRVKISVAPQPGQENQSIESIFLNEGNLLCVVRGNHAVKPCPVNTKVYTSWQSDQLIFDNTKFRDILKRLTETYNVQFDVEAKLLDQTISGSIENSTLDIIINALAKTLQAKTHRNGNKITIKSTPV